MDTENLSDELSQNNNQSSKTESPKNTLAKIFTSNHLDEIGFLVMILLMLIFSFLIFYIGLPTLLDKLDVTTLFLFF